jgi:SOS response associated peptidase (SRAP)
MAKQWGIERYKDFLISSSPMPTFATGFKWNSQGIVLRPGRLGSIVEVKRIQGPIFTSKEEAEQHGLQLCKGWIDNRLDPSHVRR